MTGLEALGRDLFVVEGPIVRDMGMPFTTRMTVVRLGDGSLWIASPVPVPFAVLADIVALGRVRYLVSPTPRHFWRLNGWHDLFPEAELWSSPITPFTLKKGDLPLTGVLGDQVPDQWAGDLGHVLVRGSRWLNEVFFFHAASRTLLVEDLVQVHEPRQGHPLRNALVTLGGVASPMGGVARDIRLTFRDRRAARESIDRVLQWDFDQIVLAHGPVITHDARGVVEGAFAWLQKAEGHPHEKTQGRRG